MANIWDSEVHMITDNLYDVLQATGNRIEKKHCFTTYIFNPSQWAYSCQRDSSDFGPPFLLNSKIGCKPSLESRAFQDTSTQPTFLYPSLQRVHFNSSAGLPSFLLTFTQIYFLLFNHKIGFKFQKIIHNISSHTFFSMSGLPDPARTDSVGRVVKQPG